MDLVGWGIGSLIGKEETANRSDALDFFPSVLRNFSLHRGGACPFRVRAGRGGASRRVCRYASLTVGPDISVGGDAEEATGGPRRPVVKAG